MCILNKFGERWKRKYSFIGDRKTVIDYVIVNDTKWRDTKKFEVRKIQMIGKIG